MNWFELHPWIQEAGRTSLAVGVLVLLVLMVRKPFARRFGAKAAYALWLLPLVRFVMPPLPSQFSLTGWLGAAPEAAAPLPMLAMPRAPSTMTFVDGPIAEPITLVPVDQAVEAGPSLMDTIIALAPIGLTTLWLLGAAIWLGRSLYQQHVFRKLISFDSAPASPRLQAEALRVAKALRLRRVPEVRVSLLCSGPLVTGLVRPVVLLPQWFEDDYTLEEQNDALVHELTHLRRGDLWAFQIARIVAATQWFNPLVYPALTAFRTDQESACDADVLRQDTISPAAYGRTLVKAARLARPSDRRIAAASLTLAHPIKERLIMMQHPKPSLRSRLTGTALAGAIGTAALFATASCMSAQAEKPEDTSQVRTYVFNGASRSGDNLQMILLSDPLAAMHPQLENLKTIEFDFDAMDIPEPPEPPEELTNFVFSFDFAEGEEFAFSTTDEAGRSIFERREGETEDEFETRVETWAAEIERKAEVWAERAEAQADEVERRTEVIALRFEKDMAAWETEHAAKFEAFGARMEEAFGEDFEAGMEAAGAVVESLAEQCEARDENDPTPEIVSATNEATGETHRALCLNAEREQLKSQALADWVNARSDLSDAEKAAFMKKRNQTEDLVFSFGAFDHELDDESGKKVVIKRIDRRSEVSTTQDDLEGADEE